MSPKYVFAVLALPLALAACQTPAALPSGPPLGNAPRFAPIVPDDVDHAAADLAVAALAADRAQTARALGRMETAVAREDRAIGLGPLAQETANAVLFPGRPGRAATERLLARDDVDAATRERLERSLADDPWVLAEQRIADARFVEVARVFNAVSAPVGRSISNASLLPYSLGRALARVAIDVAREDPLPLRRRQALALWKEFKRRHPDAPEAADLGARIDAYQQDWHSTQHDRALELAEDALDEGRPRAARLYALRAERHEASDAATDALERADAAIETRHRRNRQAMRFQREGPLLAAGERGRVLHALGATEAINGPAANIAPDLDAEDRFRRVSREPLRESRRAGFEALAREEASPMARHASAWLADPARNAEGAFLTERRAERWRSAVWVMLGPLASGPRDAPLGRLEYLLDLPARVQGASLLPFRLARLPWREPTPGERRMAVHARRALDLDPEADSSEALRDWLVGYERKRGNWIGALRIAQARSARDESELDELRERAGAQALGVARSEVRRPLRAAMLGEVARTYRETRAGAEAGRLAREEAIAASDQAIRLSRGFLVENPSVAGPRGLDLASGLLDEDLSNGELHDEGVVFSGGRRVKIHVVAAGEDEDAPPEVLQARLAPEHLARLVARLEETSFRNALLDSDDGLQPDPLRDAWFERARLGLADPSESGAAGSEFAYRGMRERYGMVRSRESILPFELVLQGSLAELTLGAFPRLRPPRETPDALLYRE